MLIHNTTYIYDTNTEGGARISPFYLICVLQLTCLNLTGNIVLVLALFEWL